MKGQHENQGVIVDDAVNIAIRFFLCFFFNFDSHVTLF
jgi:hypothetical protein